MNTVRQLLDDIDSWNVDEDHTEIAVQYEGEDDPDRTFFISGVTRQEGKLVIQLNRDANTLLD